MSKFGLPVPPFLDDVVECTDQDGNTTFNTEMLGASILGLGAGGRVYNISSGPDNDLYVEVGGEKGFLEQVPSGYGNPIDMVTTGAPHLVRFAGLDVALNEVLVLTSTGALLHWDPRLYPNGWTEVVRGGGPFVALTSHHLGTAHPTALVMNGAGLLGLWWVETPNNVVIPTASLGSGTSFARGVSRWAVGGQSFISNFGNGIENWFTSLPGAETPFALKDYQQWIDEPINDYWPYDVTRNDLFPDPNDPNGVIDREKFAGRMVGPQLFERWAPAPGMGVYGFFTSSIGRVYVMLSNIPAPEETPAEEWKTSHKRILMWPESLPPSTQDVELVSVDPVGGPTYGMPVGWGEVPSLSRHTYRMPLAREKFAFDVFVPAVSGWAGDVQMSIDVPSAGLWDQWVGWQSLDNLPRGEWTTVEIDTPTSIQAVINGDYPNARLRTFINAGLDGVLVRGLRVTGSQNSSPRPPHNPLIAMVRTNQLLDFEEAESWWGEAAELQGARVSSGVKALRLNTDGWVDVASRYFTASEIPAVGATMTLDVYIPDPRPNSYWLGSVQAYVSCPAQNLNNAFLGQVELTHLYSGEWNTVQFPMSTAVQAALSSGASCSISLGINTAQTDLTDAFFVDRVGFLN